MSETVCGETDLCGILGWEGERGGLFVDGCLAGLPGAGGRHIRG